MRYSQTDLLLKQQGIGTECEAINQIIETENKRREIIDCEIAQLKAKFAKKRKFEWKPSPQRKALQEFWSEVQEKESRMTLSLAHVWQCFKDEAKHFLHDIPNHARHERRVQEDRQSHTRDVTG